MRTRRFFPLFFSVPAVLATSLLPSAAFAQVTEAERAGARELFMQGDALQRQGHFAEALDKFQRAQQVFGAPTNVLRIAECNAALGRLVESAEAYREVIRTPLPPNAPPAFQAAIEQAKGELSQVEPRIPKLIVQVNPAGVQGPQMQIDGQNVPAALLGEPMPLDAGPHKISVTAPGYAMTEGSIELKEHEVKTAAVNLSAIPGVTYAPAGAAPVARLQPAPDPPAQAPPPPPDASPLEPKRSSIGFILGLHLGIEGAAGTVPTPDETGYQDVGALSSSGVAFGLDGSFRFGRHWLVGLTVDHADLGLNSGNQKLNSGNTATSNTTLLAANFAFVGNPDHFSFYGELGFGERWFSVHERATDGSTVSHGYDNGEFNLGLGFWIPGGRYVRIVPKATVSFASLHNSNTSAAYANGSNTSFMAVGMLGVAGYYNLDL